MIKWFTILACFIGSFVQAQGDMVVIKKNNITFKTYFVGSIATFVTSSGEGITTTISAIRNDSIFFRELDVRQVMTAWGVPRLDTVATILRGIHYSEVAAIPKPRKFSELSVAKLLMVGGAGFLAVNAVNSIYHKYSFLGSNNLRYVLPAAGAFVTGFAISKLSSRYYMIGKKYTVHYLPVGTP